MTLFGQVIVELYILQRVGIMMPVSYSGTHTYANLRRGPFDHCKFSLSQQELQK